MNVLSGFSEVVIDFKISEITAYERRKKIMIYFYIIPCIILCKSS